MTISVIKKDKKLFKGSGIRLGIQEVTRYGWGVEEMNIIAEILFMVYKNQTREIAGLLKELNNREIQYTFREV